MLNEMRLQGDATGDTESRKKRLSLSLSQHVHSWRIKGCRVPELVGNLVSHLHFKVQSYGPSAGVDQSTSMWGVTHTHWSIGLQCASKAAIKIGYAKHGHIC